MPQWLRNLVMLVGLGAWLAVVIVTLIRGQLPDAILLGVPAGLVLALVPPSIGRRRASERANQPPEETAS
jgi:hypothetical protein